MCDYSLHHVKSRAAKVGDKITTRNFGTGTRGFAAPEDAGTAVCVLPGTELAFSQEPACMASGPLGWGAKTINHQTAIFRQVNKDHRSVRGPGSDGAAASRAADDRGWGAGTVAYVG
jgi:hypothetical protein